MNTLQHVQSKIQDKNTAQATIEQWKAQGEQIVFTNGCFDLLHYGHLHYLAEAKTLGDKLIIGLNSASSVQRLKGLSRPINDDSTRSHLLAAFSFVDLVVFFEEDTPIQLIRSFIPDVLVKGGDYEVRQIVGYKEITERGGKVCVLPFIQGYSSTNIIHKVQNFNI